MASIGGGDPANSTAVTISLEEEDIEGASLDEHLETRTIPQLRWWLLYHGRVPPASEMKKAPTNRYVGHLKLLTYLAEGVGNAKGSMVFRALKRGYIHWASGRLRKLEVQTHHPQYVFVRCSMIPSMRAGTYTVALMLKKQTVDDHVIGKVHQASCDCAAGLSASSVHMSALLHGLVALKPTVPSCMSGEDDSDEHSPVTSVPCQWKPPRKHKASAMEVSVAEFEKHQYGIPKKYNVQALETFDPRPVSMRSIVAERVPELLTDVKGKGLCVSLLLDPTVRVEVSERSALMLTKTELLEKVEDFKKLLQVSDQDVCQIEKATRDQSRSLKWFEVRRFRLTASCFGRVKQLKPSTAPDNLVLSILGVKKAYGTQLEYGKSMEKTALEEYVKYQHHNGHQDLYATSSGVIISCMHPFLGASPDASVYDPSYTSEPFGFAEIKCSYKYQDVTPSQAATNTDFMLRKRTHAYFSQVQGQMAIGGRNWCDFVVYTKKGISIERLTFDQHFWEHELLPKLHDFYNFCIAPEIVSPQHPFGLPLRDLRHDQ